MIRKCVTKWTWLRFCIRQGFRWLAIASPIEENKQEVLKSRVEVIGKNKIGYIGRITVGINNSVLPVGRTVRGQFCAERMNSTTEFMGYTSWYWEYGSHHCWIFRTLEPGMSATKTVFWLVPLPLTDFWLVPLPLTDFWLVPPPLTDFWLVNSELLQNIIQNAFQI